MKCSTCAWLQSGSRLSAGCTASKLSTDRLWVGIVHISMHESLLLVSLCPLCQLTTHTVIDKGHDDITALPPRHVTRDVIGHMDSSQCLLISRCKRDWSLLVIVDDKQQALCSPIQQSLCTAPCFVDCVYQRHERHVVYLRARSTPVWRHMRCDSYTGCQTFLEILEIY